MKNCMSRLMHHLVTMLILLILVIPAQTMDPSDKQNYINKLQERVLKLTEKIEKMSSHGSQIDECEQGLLIAEK